MRVAAGYICPKDGRAIAASGEDTDEWLKGTCDTCFTVYNVAPPNKQAKSVINGPDANATPAPNPTDPAAIHPLLTHKAADPVLAGSPDDTVDADVTTSARPTPQLAVAPGIVTIPNAPAVADRDVEPALEAAPGNVPGAAPVATADAPAPSLAVPPKG